MTQIATLSIRDTPRWTSSDPTRFCAISPVPRSASCGTTPAVAADSGVLLIGATHTFDETPRPDVILVPGGMSTFEHAQDERLLEWVRQAHQTSTWTTSVCSIADSGCRRHPKGTRATSHWMVVPMLAHLRCHAGQRRRIVHEGRIASAAGVSAGSTSDCGSPLSWAERRKAKRSNSRSVRPATAVRLRHVSKASASTRALATASLTKQTIAGHQLSQSAKLL